MSVVAISTVTVYFRKTNGLEMNDDVVTDLCPDIVFITSKSMCSVEAMHAMFISHSNMQTYGAVWYSYSFKGPSKK